MGKLTKIKSAELSAWVYEPDVVVDPSRLMVCVHGISRNARQHAKVYSSIAASQGVRLIAPDFSKAEFPGYQRLSSRPGMSRADLALNRLLLQLQTQFTGLRLDLIGYSGGAQFCHRFALCYPERLRRLVLASPGWFTFPDAEVPYPRGLARWPKGLRGPARAEQMLAIPTLVLVGSDDRLRDSSLRTDPVIDQQQGVDRVERAYNWLEAWRGIGATHDWQLIELPGVGHDFKTCAMQTDMIDRIEKFLREEGKEQR